MAVLYGANDQIIEPPPMIRALERLPPDARTAWYANGWHLLNRDHRAAQVFADVEAFLRDARAPWPSGAPAIPDGLRAIPVP